MSLLVDKADGFANTLTEIVNGTICNEALFVATPLAEGPIDLAWVWPQDSRPGKPQMLPIVGSQSCLWLRTWFQVRLDVTGEYLAVHKSVFALYPRRYRPSGSAG